MTVKFLHKIFCIMCVYVTLKGLWNNFNDVSQSSKDFLLDYANNVEYMILPVLS